MTVYSKRIDCKRNTVVLALLIALICTATSVNAAEWQQYFENTKGVRFYIDTSSHIRLPNGNMQAWQKREKEPDDGILYLVEVNCSERKYFFRSVSAVKKTAENLKMLAETSDWYKEWMNFEPNDLDEDTLATWCISSPHATQ